MKAAAWLGEAGDPTAITMLKQVYKDDPDPKVRDTAQYSLGMFRKLEEELKKPDQSKVQKLLEDVAVRGKMGRRLPIGVRSLVKLEIAMLISAILVAVLALFVPPLFNRVSIRSSSRMPIPCRLFRLSPAKTVQRWWASCNRHSPRSPITLLNSKPSIKVYWAVVRWIASSSSTP